MSDWEDEPVMSESAQGGSSGSSRTCYKCKQEGHMAFECTESSGGGGGGGGGGSRACFKCKEEGHMSRDCPNAGDSDKKRGCFKCGEGGHMSRECPNNDGDDNKKKGCFKCGEEGHMSRECPTGGGSKGCFKCGEEGHMARECTNPEKERSPEDMLDEDGNPRPPIYVPEHVPDEQLFNEGVHAGINFAAYEKIEVKISGEGEWLPRIKEFEDSDLRDILKENIKKSGYTHPTPIQRNCIPIIMGGRDIMGCAQTGSGKTAAFMLPILDRLLKDGDCSTSMSMCAEPSALIVAPTRELAIQIHNEGRKFAINSVLKVVVVYGGASTGSQARTLQSGCSVLVATPGRLMDFIKKGKISLSKLKFMVLDEADRMLDMGFVGDIETLMNNPDMPDKSVRQSLMFSATFPTEIQQLAGKYLNNYVFCVVGMVGAANSDVTQEIISVEKTNKRQKLLEVMQDINSESSENKILIFVETKRTADFLASYLSSQKVNSTSIHGDRFQSQREEALAQFKLGVRSVLVATAVAARGLDIRGVTHVINYDLPKDVDEYVHRIGRTGRVGNSGKAISFFDESMDGTIAKSLVQKLKEAEISVPEFLENSAAGGLDGAAFASEDIRGEGTSAAFGGPLPADDDEEW